MTWQTLLAQQLLNGLTIGVVYALIALGYTMVYGILQLINFAHGEIFMVGAYFGLTVLFLGTWTIIHGGTPWALLSLMFIIAMLGCSVLGVGIERLAYRPLRQAPKLASLITAIGISFILQNAVMLIWGATDRPVPPVLPSVRWTIGGVSLTLMQVAMLCVTGTMMTGLQLFIMRTRLGLAMRAVAQDVRAARLMGIHVNGVITVSFLLGSALAAVGGVLYGLYYGTINFHDGYLTGLKAFTAAVLGGIGNIPGAMVGGICLGLLEGLGAGYLSSQWKNALAFLVLVLLLICRPTGLLGERVADRA